MQFEMVGYVKGHRNQPLVKTDCPLHWKILLYIWGIVKKCAVMNPQKSKNSHQQTYSGASGSGKTHMACALGMEACKQRFKTKYIRRPDLPLELEMARMQNSYKKILMKYVGPKLLILDE